MQDEIFMRSNNLDDVYQQVFEARRVIPMTEYETGGKFY